jgi:signal transduction histidine kinase
MGLSDEELHKLRHDLRSPLVVIGGFAQLLADDREISETDRRDYAERIHRAAEDLGTIIDRALGKEF